MAIRRTSTFIKHALQVRYGIDFTKLDTPISELINKEKEKGFGKNE